MVLGGAQVLRRIQVSKRLRGKATAREFVLRDYPHRHLSKQRINLVPAASQGKLSQIGEFLPINSAQRLQVPRRPGHGHHRSMLSSFAHQVIQKTLSDERHVHGQDQVQFRLRTAQCSVNSAQRPMFRELILHHFAERSKLGPTSQNVDIRSNRGNHAKSTVQQRPSLKFEEGLVRAHPAATSPSQDECTHLGHAAIIHKGASGRETHRPSHCSDNPYAHAHRSRERK